MLPHDELFHYGVMGMRWGVRNAGQRHQDTQEKLNNVVTKNREVSKKLRSEGHRYQSQLLDYKSTNSIERDRINKQSNYDLKKTRKQNSANVLKVSKKRNENMAKANRANAKRALSNKDANFWDKLNARSYNAAAARQEYNARILNRRIQRKLGQPVSKMSREDRNRRIKDIERAALLVAVIATTN